MMSDNQEMANWAANALSQTTITGAQAKNLLAVQQFLSGIASGDFVVITKAEAEIMKSPE
jgi:hypothetical protein